MREREREGEGERKRDIRREIEKVLWDCLRTPIYIIYEQVKISEIILRIRLQS